MAWLMGPMPHTNFESRLNHCWEMKRMQTCWITQHSHRTGMATKNCSLLIRGTWCRRPLANRPCGCEDLALSSSWSRAGPLVLKFSPRSLIKTRRCSYQCQSHFITSGARSAERVLLWFKGEISECAAQPDPTRPDATRPNPTQPDPTRPHHAFEKLISLERVDRFTSGLLCSMSPFNKFHIWPTPIPAGACHDTWHVPRIGCRRHPLPR